MGTNINTLMRYKFVAGLKLFIPIGVDMVSPVPGSHLNLAFRDWFTILQAHLKDSLFAHTI